ncbi:MAG: hypothetical protein COB46_14055 [Rhodospirillaceae bacterium]|nr:MAG: hypothetical protein COB46_14055 [Rhodospirillaceae bacterium]
MGQIIKFFGWLILGIAMTLVIFGHLTMILIYDMAYLMETLFPSDPESISSIWIIMGSALPAAGMWLLGHGMQKLEAKAEAKEAAEIAAEAAAADQVES